MGELEGFTLVEIPGGAWREADSGRRHQGQARSSATCRAHQEEA